MKSIIILLVILPLAAVSQKNFVDQNYIEVQGQAVIKVVPDLIYLRVYLSERQKNTGDVAVKEKQMLQRLKDLGIDPAKDVVVKDLNSNYKSRAFSGDNVLVSKAYILCVHDAKSANNVISELEKLEISNVHIDRLDHSKMADFKKECNIKAIVAAKAEYLTQAVGQSTGRAIYIEETTNVPRPVPFGGNANYQMTYRQEAMMDKDSQSNLDFDEIKIECTVLARFELK